MPKHFKYVGNEPRIYSELPYAFGVVQPGQIVESDQDEPPNDNRWEKSSKTALDRQKKSAENAEPAEPVTTEPLEQPPAVQPTDA